MNALILALDGRPDAHFRWMLKRLHTRLEALDAELAAIDAQMAEHMAEHENLIDRLDGIPGVDRTTAQAVIAELGTDMTVFPDAAHLASWAGLCPGNAESAGKRFSGRTHKGAKRTAWSRDRFLNAPPKQRFAAVEECSGL